jgi:formylmethanofuran dehydrogenase subunit E
LLRREIREAGADICGIEEVKVTTESGGRQKSSSISVCPLCEEAYRSADGAICPACQGGVLPYGCGKGPRRTGLIYAHKELCTISEI